MAWAMVGVAVVGAGVKMYQANQNRKAAEKAAKKAEQKQLAQQAKLDKEKAKYSQLQFENPYENVENVYEDLTVNQQQAQFEAQQGQQQRANIMQGLKGAAGSSGIAALAQTMANQASQEAQMASANIATQEAANQKAERAEAGNIQELQRQGDAQVENLKRDRMMTQIGMTQGELAAENQNVADAQAAMMSGVGDIGSGLGSLGGHASSMMDEGKTFGGKTRKEGMGFFGGTS